MSQNPRSRVGAIPFVDLTKTFWWPRRVYAARAGVAGYQRSPVVFRTLVTNVALDATRGRLEPAGGPVVALCADLCRFLVGLGPPQLATYGPDEASEWGVPVMRLGGWLRRGVRLQRVGREETAPSKEPDAGLSGSLQFLEELHERWGERFVSVAVVGWPVYPGRTTPWADGVFLDACTGQAIFREPGR